VRATALSEEAASRLRTFAELSRAVLLRSALYAVLLFVLLEGFQGSVNYAFLAVTVFVVVVMHEALHMVGMEAAGTQHSETFRVLAVGYATVGVDSNGRILLAVLSPFLVMFPLGAYLVTSSVPALAAVGWSVIIMHGCLLPIELGTIRSRPAR
jgi:hypothetical protein